jgi:hypothetical protein
LRVDEINQAVKMSEHSEDLREGAAAWREKRAANFMGK